MRIRRFLMVFSVAVFLLAAAPTLADAGPKLVLKLMAEKQVMLKGDDGKMHTEWHKVDETDPGDVLRYTLSYTNEGDADATGAAIVDPVPSGTSYIGGSASGKGTSVTYSLDGKSFQAAPKLHYRVRQADGTEVEYTATPAMYTHIRWALTKPVLPGGKGTVVFNVQVK